MKKKPDSRWIGFMVFLARLGLLLAAATCITLWATGDRWWGSFALLFGPRWSTAALLVFPLPLLLARPKRGAGYMLLSGLVVVVGIMGFRLGPARLFRSGHADVRVLTYNVASRGAIRDSLLTHLEALGIDIAIAVECPGPNDSLLPDGWRSRSQGEVCLFSRFPITAWAPFPQSTSLARGTVDVRGVALDVGLLHLTSPRDALTRFLDVARTSNLRASVDRNSAERKRKAIRADAYLALQDGRPLVVGGDFNLPPESTLFWGLFDGFRDAFEQAGAGFGYTWRSRWHGLRIDHLLTRGGVHAVRTWTGPDLGSDHLPVVADLALPR